MYSLVGYDKDNDLYEIIENNNNLKYLISKGKKISKIQNMTDNFRSNSTKEPFDWFSICDIKNAIYPYKEEIYWNSFE